MSIFINAACVVLLLAGALVTFELRSRAAPLVIALLVAPLPAALLRVATGEGFPGDDPAIPRVGILLTGIASYGAVWVGVAAGLCVEMGLRRDLRVSRELNRAIDSRQDSAGLEVKTDGQCSGAASPRGRPGTLTQVRR